MSAQKRHNSDEDDGPPQKLARTESSIEYAMLMQKFKAVETQWKERGLALSKKQEEINLVNKQKNDMRAGYEEKIKHLNELLVFRACITDPQHPSNVCFRTKKRRLATSKNHQLRLIAKA